MSVLDFVGGLVDTGINTWQAYENRNFQASEAEKNRNFQVSMYDRQLDDSIAWRTHQEQYNSPQAQMQRYRDAGINPMYAVTGSGGNMVTTPMSMTSGFGSSPSGGSQVNSSVGRGLSSAIEHKLQKKQFDLNMTLGDSAIHKQNADAAASQALAEKYLAEAEGIRSENEGRALDADVNRFLRQMYIRRDGTYEESFAEFKATRIAEAEKYQKQYDALSFKDAKAAFIHSSAVRKFESDLMSHKRSLFEHELSQAESAAEVFSVAAKWAIANQWINAASSVISSALGIVGAFKGTSLMPSVSRSFTESYGDHTSRTFHYNQ